MLHKFMKYLFPTRSVRDKLPLLSVAYSGEHYRGDSGKINQEWITILIQLGIARTRADALRVIKQHKGKTLQQIVNIEKRKHRHVPRMILAWRRFKRLW